MTSYEPTAKLKDAKFRGQKALVCQALTQQKGPKTLEEIATKVEKTGGYRINGWAKGHGGLEGSVRYHLNGLAGLKMVTITEQAERTSPKASKPAKAKEVA